MKLRNLLEETTRQVFLDFQQRLIELDDGFEQFDPVKTAIQDSYATKFRFFRPKSTKAHNVRTIILICYHYHPLETENSNLEVESFRIEAFGKTQTGETRPLAVGRKIFSTNTQTLDEVFIYLDRIINAKA